MAMLNNQRVFFVDWSVGRSEHGSIPNIGQVQWENWLMIVFFSHTFSQTQVSIFYGNFRQDLFCLTFSFSPCFRCISAVFWLSDEQRDRRTAGVENEVIFHITFRYLMHISGHSALSRYCTDLLSQISKGNHAITLSPEFCYQLPGNGAH